MLFEHHTSTPGSTRRQEGFEANVVFGGSCIICGKWVEVDLGSAMEYAPKKSDKLTEAEKSIISIAQGIKRISDYDLAVWSFRESIDKQMEDGISVDTIANLLLQSDREKYIHRKRMKASIARYISGRMAVLMEKIEAKRMEESGVCAV
jgi:hypothetical protein